MHTPSQSLERGVDSHAAHAVVPMVVVPTFNHGPRVCGVLDGLRPLGLPIIVVDDGSSDDTQARLEQWTRHAPDARVQIRRHEINRGKAAALRTGFDAAHDLGATHAVTIDADGQLEPADIPALVEIARQHPQALVLGERPIFMPGRPARCDAGRRSTSLAVRAECGIRITDSQCGLRVYPLALVRGVRCFAGRYSFEAEIIARAVWAGFEVISVPVRCQYLAKNIQVSHYRPWRDTLRQAVVHARLLLRAVVPWPHRKIIHNREGLSAVGSRLSATDTELSAFGSQLSASDHQASAESREQISESRKPRADSRKPLSQFLQWINPMRCLRDARTADIGRMELAASLAIGVWIGVSPFFGLHVLICMYFAWRLHLHPAPMVLGSQISVPPIGVLLAVVSTAIGNFLLTGHGLPSGGGAGGGGDLVIPSWTTWPTFAWHWFSAWLLGSLILGFVLAVTVFWITLLLGSWRSASARPHPHLRPRIAEADEAAADQFTQP